MKRLIPLASIEVFVWAILLLSTLLISRVVSSISLGNATAIERIATAIVRDIVSGAVVVVWLLVWKKVTDIYMWKALARKATATA